MAAIDRLEPFLSADRQRIEEQCKRITNGQELLHSTVWRDERDVQVVHFGEESHAVAFAKWAWQERITA